MNALVQPPSIELGKQADAPLISESFNRVDQSLVFKLYLLFNALTPDKGWLFYATGGRMLLKGTTPEICWGHTINAFVWSGPGLQHFGLQRERESRRGLFLWAKKESTLSLFFLSLSWGSESIRWM